MNIEAMRLTVDGCIIGLDVAYSENRVVMIHWMSYRGLTQILESSST